ncbi:MAG: flagellar hook-length control protein FliK [Alphaproteobacteria bacterium]|nr:flagellar hook-length control protein FliK [Alphaproteobacteria bacterium]
MSDQPGAGQGETSSQGQGHASAEALVAAASDVAATPDAPTLSQAAAAPIVAAAVAPPPLRAETRGSPETVAQLSAEILKKLDAQTTRFDVALTPEGLGKVDVRIEIGRHGALTASMAFDTAQAAAELRGKSSELRQALSQAGFTVDENALRFDVSSQGGGQSNQNAFFNFNGGEDGRRAWSGKAFQTAETVDPITLSPSDLLPGLRMAPDSGLDIRI